MNQTANGGIRITLLSLHGLIRAHEPELGRDSDTGGQIKYVLELANELGRREDVASVELVTRQIFDDRVGPDYAQVEERINNKAKIFRIPFGPKRYLRKELLWPFLESFVDQMLGHFRRVGLPDVIHGHYADAGYAGAQLSRLAHIPYVFTGHSLGRVKRMRMLKNDQDSVEIDEQYQFPERNEAEEMALETASLVITSTSQEVQEQYELYDHYQPDRMEVIPPGVDLELFRPDDPSEPLPPIAEQIEPFLRDTEKPIVLTVARPDERKNIEMLVRVFGENPKLRNLANLVLLLGTRDDIRQLPPAQRKVLLNIINLIDVYNLYGHVAYPKGHKPADIPDLYRLAARRRGVFVNPALTEPFGLTLLEAAGCGLPILATHDGGPRDIIANCKNGLLVDPLDPEAIDHAIMRALTERDQWQEWSQNGIAGATEYYNWSTHADRYLRDVKDILAHSAKPALAVQSESRQSRRLPDFDRMIITDLDNTLIGDDEALEEFKQMLKDSASHIGFGIATGRRLDDVLKLIEHHDLPRPDVIASSAGTQLHYGAALNPDRSWRQQISFQWEPDEVRRVLGDVPGLFPQAEHEQSEFKISYELDAENAPKINDLRKILREAGMRAKVVLSLGMYLDVVPIRAGSDLSMRHLAYRWGFEPERLLIAGDSGNDEGMLKGRTLGVVVGNYSPELERLRKLPRIYFATATHARGIMEGIQYYDFLNHITIPNDRTE